MLKGAPWEVMKGWTKEQGPVVRFTFFNEVPCLSLPFLSFSIIADNESLVLTLTELRDRG